VAAKIYRSVMVVMDGGEKCMGAARAAVEIARELGSSLYVATVVDTETLNRLLQRHILVEEERATFERELEHDARRYINYVRQLTEGTDIPVESVVLKGSLHRCVIDEATKRKIDLIVLGGWTHSMVRREIVPRERQIILDEAECAVLVVKGKEA